MNVPSVRGLHEPSFDSSHTHEITPFGVPRRRTGHHDVRGVYESASVNAEKWECRVLTQVCHRPYFASDFFLGILPQTGQEVDDQIHGRFAGLSKGNVERPHTVHCTDLLEAVVIAGR